jgi:hypothetical protein
MEVKRKKQNGTHSTHGCFESSSHSCTLHHHHRNSNNFLLYTGRDVSALDALHEGDERAVVLSYTMLSYARHTKVEQVITPSFLSRRGSCSHRIQNKATVSVLLFRKKHTTHTCVLQRWYGISTYIHTYKYIFKKKNSTHFIFPFDKEDRKEKSSLSLSSTSSLRLDMTTTTTPPGTRKRTSSQGELAS